jgi:methanogenic corrinoid protein MtbC1
LAWRAAGAAAPVPTPCPPGEQHDLGLIAFGLALRAHGWRITYLGQDTPLAGAGASSELADKAGARLLGEGPVTAAARVATT